MKVIKMENSSVKEVYSGVYKINFPNGKCYIGISNNMYRRMLEHNTDFRNNLPIEHAIKKYGKIIEFEILEEISPDNRELMREREKYWIEFYQSTDKDKGYNVSLGGDGADFGSQNHEAKFTEEEILAIYDDLKNNLNFTLQEIANKYGVNLTTISHINNGRTYYHSSVSYPIRNSIEAKTSIRGINNPNSILNEETLNEIYKALKFEPEVSMKELAERFGMSSTVIQNINSGKTYKKTNQNYPIRISKTGARKLNQEQVLEIIDIIKNNPNNSLASIARQLKISAKAVSSINCGTVYKQPNENYPIRKKH